MAIVIKLREYKADEECSDSVSLVRILAGCGLGLVLVAVLFLCLVGDEMPRASAFVAGSHAPSSSKGAGGASGFGRTNWGYLAPGDESPARRLLDTDLDCPEWEGREDLKGLKAMAVSEVKSPGAEAEESRIMAEEIFRVKR